MDNRRRSAVLAPPAFLSLEIDRAERICRIALGAQDRNAALRFLLDTLPEVETAIPGVRNEGLFATHELKSGLPSGPRWAEAKQRAEPLLAFRGEKLLQELGFHIERTPGLTSILRADDRRCALALLLQENESMDYPASVLPSYRRFRMRWRRRIGRTWIG